MSLILRKLIQKTIIVSAELNPRNSGQRLFRQFGSTTDTTTTTTTNPTNTNSFDKDKFEKLVKTNKVVVFMKGDPEQPRCGFSNAVVQIMRMHGVHYDAINVLENEEIRQGIKEFSNWPTIPQIYLNGEFVGGCDILLQMHQSGDLIEELQKCGISSALKNSPPPPSSNDK